MNLSKVSRTLVSIRSLGQVTLLVVPSLAVNMPLCFVNTGRQSCLLRMAFSASRTKSAASCLKHATRMRRRRRLERHVAVFRGRRSGDGSSGDCGWVVVDCRDCEKQIRLFTDKLVAYVRKRTIEGVELDPICQRVLRYSMPCLTTSHLSWP